MLAGRYRIDAPIGQGAFASTYRATDTTLQRTVAVKLLRSHHVADVSFLARFEREARAAAQLNHPNVVQVHDYGHEDEHVFIVMHYVAGPTLAGYIRDREQISSDEVIAIMSQVLEGLQAIHERGIVHRDIKPQNILLEPDLTPKLGDFGVAHSGTESSLTQTGTTIGTAAYMAPEQATGEESGPRADLYAVGAVLFELLTGQLPFSAPTPVQVMYQHVNLEVTPPRQINPSIPASLETVILRALAKRPEQRFASADEMRRALQAAGHGTNEILVAAPAGYSDQPTQASAGIPPPDRPAPRTIRAGRDEPARWPYGLLFLVVVLAIVAILAVAMVNPGGLRLPGGSASDETSATPDDAGMVTPVSGNPPAVAEPEPTPEPPPPEQEPTPEMPPPTPEPEPTSVPVETDAVQQFVQDVPANVPFNPEQIPEQILDGPSLGFGRDDFVAGGAYRRPDGVLYEQPAAHLYSHATDFPSTTVAFTLPDVPDRYAVIRIVGMDDESPTTVPIRVSVNGYVVHEGPAPFGSEVWTDTAWRVDDLSALLPGENVLVIEVVASDGEFGRPPWLLLTAMRIYTG
jgi:eukaryotic-like serine/threonine-protein kinase